MVKEEIYLNLNKDLIEYLDNINLNYNIAITNEKELLYNNINEDNQELSGQFKEFLKRIYTDKKITEYFNNNESFETYNLNTSQNLILNKEKKTKSFGLSDNFIYLINNLIFTKNNNIQILKYDNFKGYPLKCIIPLNNHFFKGALIILTNETDITDEVKESFFRFCYGLFFIVNHYINYSNYSKYKLL